MHNLLRDHLRTAVGTSEFVVALNLDIRGFSSFFSDSSQAAAYLSSIYAKILDDRDAMLDQVPAGRGRRSHTRRLRWLASAAALLVTATMVWVVARPGQPVAGVPAPLASPSATTGQASVTLDLDVDASLPYQDATFEIRREHQNLTISVKATKDGKTTRTLGTYQSQADAIWSKKVDNDLQLALLPGYADQVTSVSVW